ncbi:hypothetical protein [Nostoc sp. FACHB-110]|uniref:hypothetical protein n=1 Tax=Nostoc sp. FACHB-110 TaxID=2692834 RepID=UPI0016821103|nr:hypothetical protein [Nostoc sp. FACHB-110]MBD2435233.1 hypothetical protein [Nostoc sp. FACHB-110]
MTQQNYGSVGFHCVTPNLPLMHYLSLATPLLDLSRGSLIICYLRAIATYFPKKIPEFIQEVGD